MIDECYDVIVVGAGAAGVGVGVALRHAGITHFLILDRHEVGASFAKWPAETRFITPSFPTNSIGMLDLNSVAIGVSPAYSLRVEHPTDDEYEVKLVDGRYFVTKQPPILANGFLGSVRLVHDLFELREDGFPLLSANDESTLTPGLFLCGPAVRHENHVFCFIYKYRQRFAVVAKAIATRLGLPADELEMYRKWGMYLDDLSCCGEECAC